MGKKAKGGKTTFKKSVLTYWRHCHTYTYTHEQGDMCVTLVVISVSKGTTVDVTGPDGTNLGPLGAGSQTQCIKISKNETIKVHANGGGKADGATGHLIKCPCDDDDEDDD